MSSNSDTALSKALGARILSEANDLKRTPEALADELNLDRTHLSKVINGELGVEPAREIVRQMADTYPVRLADLWIEPDDTDAGVKVMRAAESLAGARIFERKNREGGESRYYEYRDTAMSRLGPFKPEWIQPIRIVEDADPENPDVAYNNGHLMHQMTFFIGDVNFYWETDGKKQCAEMRTGDSNYVTPFVPHSFTSRDPDQLGLIIAVTFAGTVRRALDDFSVLGSEGADSLSGDLRESDKAFAVRLNRHLSNETQTPAGYAKRLERRGIDEATAKALSEGLQRPTEDQLAVMADELGIRPQDLLTTALDRGEDVIVKYANDEEWRNWPENNDPIVRLNPLARTRHQPSLKAFHVEAVSDRDGDPADNMRHGLFEYIYNYGDKPVRILWEDDREAILAPGDSACVRPMIGHRFSLPKGNSEPARFFLVRVPGQLDDNTLDEYAQFATDGRHRVAKETKRWF